MAYSDAEEAMIVVGVTCPLGSCANLDADASQQSDIAFAQLDPDNGAINYQERVIGASGEFANTHSDVAHSVVLQIADGHHGQGNGHDHGNGNGHDTLFFVIGGYSVDSDGSATYMSGARFRFDKKNDPDEYEFFRSDFANSTGDQTRELRLQSDNRIVAGGFHTESGAATFAAVRLCEDPDETCDQGNAPSPGDGGGFNFGALGTAQDAGSPSDQSMTPANSPSSTPDVPASAPPISADASETQPQTPPDVGQRPVLIDKPVQDGILEPQLGL
jgi:hypothetical protein